MGLQNIMAKAKRLARGNKKHIDKGLDKAGQIVSERTGGKHDDKIRSTRDKIDKSLTDEPDARPGGDTQPSTDAPEAEQHRRDPGAH